MPVTTQAITLKLVGNQPNSAKLKNDSCDNYGSHKSTAKPFA